MYLQKVTTRKSCVKKLRSFFAVILKVNDENIQDPDHDPNPDPLIRGMDPRFRIRIHTKIS
jgi:hypothetical protein